MFGWRDARAASAAPRQRGTARIPFKRLLRAAQRDAKCSTQAV